MPDQDDDNYQTDDATDDVQDAHEAVANAAPAEVDAHRDMLSEVLQTLEGQGVDTAGLAAGAGASTADPCEMSHGDLVSTTLALARQHPEVVQMVAQRFPAAQGLLGSVLGGSGGAGGGLGGLLSGGLGGLLGRL